ncbi:MAG: nicotinate (nicotinamide) nucleotide adenylyltransferase [Terracidiphilus sp.]
MAVAAFRVPIFDKILSDEATGSARSAPRWPQRARWTRYDEAMSQADSGDLLGEGGKRIAFFGGSFDPPHLGHLAVARAARAAFRLDTVLFAPVGAQPLKTEGSAASFEHRLAMTRLAIAGEPGFAVSLADAPRPSGGRRFAPNYTIETLKGLRATFRPDWALYCLMGADAFFGLRRWHRAAELPFVAPMIVASRPGQPLEGLKAALPQGLTLEPAPGGDRIESGVQVCAFFLVNAAEDRAPFYVLPGLDVEISASEIRAQIRDALGSQAFRRDLLPAAVREYIARHELYRA